MQQSLSDLVHDAQSASRQQVIVDPVEWTAALQWSYYTPSFDDAVAFANTMLTQDGVYAGRVMRAFQRERQRPASWWVADVYMDDDPSFPKNLMKRSIRRIENNLIERRVYIQPGWYTALRARWNRLQKSEG